MISLSMVGTAFRNMRSIVGWFANILFLLPVVGNTGGSKYMVTLEAALVYLR